MRSEINGFAVVDSVRASGVEEPPDKKENILKVNDDLMKNLNISW